MRFPIIVGLALSLTACSASTDDWLRQLKDPDVVKRREAVRELGARTAEALGVVPALTEVLLDASAYVRHDAAVVLAKFGAEARAAIPALTLSLKDKDRRVRAAAGKALKKIDPQAASRAGIR
jgi:HEAT repeat protein